MSAAALPGAADVSVFRRGIVEFLLCGSGLTGRFQSLGNVF